MVGSRMVTVVLAESLRANRAYTLFVGVGARDRHGNPLEEARSVVFTTGDSFPQGRIRGRIEAKGFVPGAASLWCYDAAWVASRTARPGTSMRWA